MLPGIIYLMLVLASDLIPHPKSYYGFENKSGNSFKDYGDLGALWNEHASFAELVGYNLPPQLDVAKLYPEAIGQSIKDLETAAPMSKCYEGLGCFTNNKEFFDQSYRPINLMPLDRRIIDTKFLLYTRSNNEIERILRADDEDSIETSFFDATLETKIIVHGYIDNQIFGKWMRELKDAFLAYRPYNVIIVDWSGGNKPPYAQATANSRVVGAEIGLLCNVLISQYRAKPEMFHILGHSLGAHIAGYAGDRMKNLGRITALDPADPLFGGMPPKVRIDPTDAQFVDVIHSDAKSTMLIGFGMSEAVGHVDFYPNSGRDQPGCGRVESGVASTIFDGIGEGVRRFTACNHQRSIDFMTQAVKQQECQMVGFHCDDYETFLSGNCYECGSNNEKCATMGLKAIEYKDRVRKTGNGTAVPTKMFFKTSKNIPFCLFHYHVSLKLKSGGSSRTGELYLTLRGTRQNSEEIQLGDGVLDLVPGRTLDFLVTTGKDLGDLKAVTLEYDSKIFKILPGFKDTISVKSLKVIPMITDDKGAQERATKSFCQKVDSPLTSRKEEILDSSELCA